jgi:LPS-assembly lipoprotein
VGSGGASDRFGEIAVDIIPDRQGQLLRQALQQHLDVAGSDQHKKYGLAVIYSVAADAISIQRDSTSTRTRLIASASWTLRNLSSGTSIVTSGSARMLDGYNIIDQQFFAADLENEDAQRRLAESLAGQITLQMAAFFNKNPQRAPV